MGAHRRAFDIHSLLDERSYRVYRMRTEEKKSFREIGQIFGLSPNRIRQIYQASLQRIELKKRGGDIWPEFSLSLRAINCIYRRFEKTNVHKKEVIEALMRSKMFPGEPYGYGWKTHREVCRWAGVALSESTKRASRL